MRTLPKVWLVLAILFVLVNALGAAYAAHLREVMHTGIHVLLMVPGVYVASRLWGRRQSPG